MHPNDFKTSITIDENNHVVSTMNGQHLFETHMNYTVRNTIFSDGNWGIIEIIDKFTNRNAPNAIVHLCKEFDNTNLHHIYHSITHPIKCTECKEPLPESVETLWRLMNIDTMHAKPYFTIFLQSTKHLDPSEEENSNILQIKSNTSSNIAYTPIPRS